MSQQMNLQQLLESAVEHHRAGRLAEAADLYRQVLIEQPHHPDIWNNLGNALQSASRFDEAMAAFSKALDFRPNFAEVYYNIGNLLTAMGRPSQAVAAFRQAIALQPSFAAAHNNLGSILKDQGQLQPAIEAARQAVTLRPDFHEAWCNFASGLFDDSQFDAAEFAAQQAVATRPDSPSAHNLLGNALRAVNDLEFARAAYVRAVELNPNFVEAQNNLGTILIEMQRFDEAIAAYERAVAIDPNHALAHHNLAMARLLLGDFSRGWREMEWRWNVREFHSQRSPHPQPIWDGGDPSGKTILIYPEQGLGDVIQFARYAPMLAHRGARVVLGCQRPLKKLLQTVPDVYAVSSNTSETPRCDFQIPAATLPQRFGTTLQTIPSLVPYIHADLNQVEQWKKRLNDFNGLKVGLVWAGRSQHPRDRQRSIPLAMLAPLSQLQHIWFFSLQKDAAASQATQPPQGMKLIDWSNELSDFSDTAALLANLDLLITVDTSVAHLAGAMGRPVWVLLPAVPDWRWLLNRTDSPWYPTMRLFRQAQADNWYDPIERLADALRARLG